MKIYFAGSIKGGRERQQDYFHLIRYISGFGQVLTEHVGYKDVKVQEEVLFSDREDEHVYIRDVKWIDECDVVIAEVSIPSLGVGYELGYAQSIGKKIICLYDKNAEKPLSYMISGNQYNKVFEYNDIKEAKSFIERYLTNINMEENVYQLLRQLKIKFDIIQHPPLFTCADNDRYGIQFEGQISKNLFLRNKDKSQYYLVSLPLEKRADLKKIQDSLGETRLSFGDEAVLEQKLKIRSGAVSMLNIANTEQTDIIFVIDNELLQHKRVGFHPNVNTATVLFSPATIKKILTHFQVESRFIDI